jgi:tryptophanyl-tRNA synthetase
MVINLADIHVRRSEYEANPSRVKEILAYGNERARKMAAATMEEVRQAMNL